jgi:hypothetical protein
MAFQMTALAKEILLHRLRRKTPITPPCIEDVQDLMDQLRDRLPDAIAYLPPLSASIDPSGRYKNTLAAYVSGLQSLHRMLFDVALPRAVSLKIPFDNWHQRAMFLLRLYIEVVGGSPGITRNGPAVRFIQAALILLDPADKQPHELAAIEKAIRRQRQERCLTKG